MKLRWIGAALAAFFMLPMLGVVAYAGGGDSLPPQVIDITPRTESTPDPVTDSTGGLPARESPATTVQPFTQAGTGTVIDHAADSDEKEFYTITTPDENVFYLVIDRQRDAENVYFLNAVTEDDLLSLAKKPQQAAPVVTGQPPAPAELEPEPTPQKGGSVMLLMVAVVILIGGGTGWYFKLYRPKQQQADSAEEFESEDEADLYGESDAALDYDSRDWDSPEPDGDSE